MISKAEIEKLNSIKETTKDFKNLEKTFQHSTDSLKEYFKQQNEYKKRYSSFKSILLCLDIVRLVICFFLVFNTFVMIKLNSDSVVIKLVNIFLSIIILVLLIITLYIKNAQLKFKAKIEKSDDKTLIDMYEFALMLSERKRYTIIKVYDDTYAIIEGLSKEPEILKKIENIKVKKHIDFNYFTKDMEQLQKLEDDFFNEGYHG